MEEVKFLKPRYVITDDTALTVFTSAQKQVILEDSNVFETFGITAFRQMSEMFELIGVDVKSLPPEMFVAFPNRYQNLGRKVLCQFDSDYKTLISTYHLVYFLSVLDDDKLIRFSLVTENKHLDVIFSYHDLAEKENLLSRIYNLFLSGNTAYCYFTDLLNTFPDEMRTVRFIEENGSAFQLNKKELFEQQFSHTIKFFRLDLADTYLQAGDEVVVPSLPSSEKFYGRVATLLVPSALENSVLKNEIDLLAILEEMGFTAPFDVDIEDDSTIYVNSDNDWYFDLFVFGNSIFFTFFDEEGSTTYEYVISTPDVSVSLTLVEPIIVYLS